MRRFRQRRLRWWIWLLKQEKQLKDEIMFDHAEGEEVLLIGARTKLGPCQVRSKTEHPCPHQAEMVFWGIPFCEACAREQEAYFAIGKLTTEAQGLVSDPELVRRIARRPRRREIYGRTN